MTHVVARLFASQTWPEDIMQWALTLLIATLIAVALRLIQRLMTRHLNDVAPTTETLWDDVLLDMVRRTHLSFQLMLGAWVASRVVTLPEATRATLHTIGILALALQLGTWGSGALNYLLVALIDRRAAPHDKTHHTGRNMLRFLGLALVWTFVLLLCCENLGVNVTAVLAGLSLGSFAIGFAIQNTLGDLIACACVVLDKQYLVGDFINVDGTFLGTVERIGVRTTRIRSLGGEEILMCNGDLARSRIRNYRTLKERRVLVSFNVAFDTPVAQLAKIPNLIANAVHDAAMGSVQLRFERAHLASLTGIGPAFEAVYWVLDADYTRHMNIQQAVLLSIAEGVEQLGSSVTFGSVSRLLLPDDVMAASKAKTRANTTVA